MSNLFRSKQSHFGGNNEEYFTKAFPAFLHFLSEAIQRKALSNVQIVLHQHPGAKLSGRDQKVLEAWVKEHTEFQVIVSQETTEDMQVLADGALYYQTSMGPLFALTGIPIIQVGHKTYPDVLVRGGISPCVTNSFEFINVLSSLEHKELSEEKRSEILQSLGVQKDWFSLLKKALFCESI